MDSLAKLRKRFTSTLRRRGGSPKKIVRSCTSEETIEIPDEIPSERCKPVPSALTNPENRVNLNSVEKSLLNDIRLQKLCVEQQKLENSKLTSYNSKLQEEVQKLKSELWRLKELYDRTAEEIDTLTEERNQLQRILKDTQREKEDWQNRCGKFRHRIFRPNETSSHFFHQGLPGPSRLGSSVSASAVNLGFVENVEEGAGSRQSTSLSEGSDELTAAVEKRLASLDSQRQNVMKEADHAIVTTGDLGTLYLKKGDFSTAARFFSLAVDLKKKILGSSVHPELFSLLETLACTYAKSGDWEKVEDCSSRLLEFPRCQRHPEKRAHVMLKLKARALQELGKTEEHEALLCDLIRLCAQEGNTGALIPLSASARCALGMIYLKKNDFTRANFYVEEALEICSNNLSQSSTVTRSVLVIHKKIRSQMAEETETVLQDPSSVSEKSASDIMTEPSVFILAPAPPGKNRKSSTNQ